MKKPRVIAEIGCNHMGQLKTAEKMIEIASRFAGVDVVKFQKRNNKILYSEQEFNKPHPVPENSYGKSYGEHREFLEFDLTTHKKLKKLCDKYNIDYSCSVWDTESAKEIISLKPNILKVPSAHNLDFPLLDVICKSHKGEIHISTGMTTKKEIKEIIRYLKYKKKLKKTVLYYCVSSYPAKDEDLCLLEINEFYKKYNKELLAIGFSGHHQGIAIDIAALTLGARYFERHFTLDRTWKGTDHAASLEPEGLRRLNRDIKTVNMTLKNWNGKFVSSELTQRKKLKKIKK